MAQSSGNTYASSKYSADLEASKYGRASPGFYQIRNKYANYGFSNGVYGAKDEREFDVGRQKMTCTLLTMLLVIIVILILVARCVPEYKPTTFTGIQIEEEPK
ncbi:hypothetical protein QAD02_024377 [Eretmocerus hayati]|uniref:Uncharacterized protein n=1 Tax=Eretmocerus hayati TaxID=131215 RepID=A0ACC2PYP1_9HYME|nr:hypothetical protein QAD02_024377 [Eretmocerus hayati]